MITLGTLSATKSNLTALIPFASFYSVNHNWIRIALI